MKRLVGFMVGLFILMALLSHPANAAGASWVDMNSQVVSLYHAGQYEKALPLREVHHAHEFFQGSIDKPPREEEKEADHREEHHIACEERQIVREDSLIEV